MKQVSYVTHTQLYVLCVTYEMPYKDITKRREAQSKNNRKRRGIKSPSGENNRGPCNICNRVPETAQKSNCYDHDHVTGEFRGWLCDNCNKGLGLFKDSVPLLSKAIEYLNKNKHDPNQPDPHPHETRINPRSSFKA